MKRFWDGLAGVLLVLWIGGMWAIGYVAAPVLFASLDDKQLAGNLAGRLFELGAWIGLAAASYLLLYRLIRDGGSALKTLFFWIVALMLGLTAASHFGIAPIMQSLKDQAMPLSSTPLKAMRPLSDMPSLSLFSMAVPINVLSPTIPRRVLM